MNIAPLSEQCLAVVAALLNKAALRESVVVAVTALPIELVERLIQHLASNDLLTESLLAQLTVVPVRRVDLSGCSLPRASLAHVAKFTALHQLNLSQCSVDDGLLSAIATRCTELRRLDVAHSNSLTRAGIVALAQHCPALEFASLLQCHGIDSVGIQSLANCKRLVKLNLGWCKLDDASLMRIATECTTLEALELWLSRDVSGPGLERAAPALSRLKKLNLWAMPGLTDAAVQALAHHCTVMESVNFQANHQLSDAAFVPLRARGGRRSEAPCSFFGGALQKVVLSDCLGITAQAVRVIIASSPLLQKINLASVSISDREVAQLAESCSHLLRLDLESTEVSAAAFRSLAAGHSLERIRTINLYGCSSIDDEAVELLLMNCTSALRKLHVVDTQVTDRALKKAFLLRPELQVLSIGRTEEPAHSITNDSLQHLHRLVYLRKLEICHVTHLTDAALVALFTHCNLLKSLCLSSDASSPCTVTDASVSLMSRLRSLSELSLVGTHLLTDASLCPIATRCTRLMSLELRAIPLLTPRTFTALSQHATQLRTLTLGEVHVTVPSLNELMRGCLRLQQLDLEWAQVSGDTSACINPRPRTLSVIAPRH